MRNPISAILVLEDGTSYQGWSFCKPNTVIGEVVFNTGMTGYQEILTDPSYYGQIVVFTYPELGNTGINLSDNESHQPCIKGLIAKNICIQPNNWRSTQSFTEYLNLHNIMNIYGLDTRALTQHLRKVGSMNGAISSETRNVNHLLQKIKLSSPMLGLDLIPQVTTNDIYSFNKKEDPQWYFRVSNLTNKVYANKLRIIILDFGVKRNILRRLLNLNCEIIVVPASSSANTILNYKPDGILLSNGPGDPAAVLYGIQTIKSLLKFTIPIFGICMGHQLLGLALGCNTFKLKFGHRGLNHPVGVYSKVEITSQNHGFAISNKSIPIDMINISHINFNDGTIAGISHKTLPIFSVQYHPEASPGPHDTDYLFLYFISTIRYQKKTRIS